MAIPKKRKRLVLFIEDEAKIADMLDKHVSSTCTTFEETAAIIIQHVTGYVCVVVHATPIIIIWTFFIYPDNSFFLQRGPDNRGSTIITNVLLMPLVNIAVQGGQTSFCQQFILIILIIIILTYCNIFFHSVFRVEANDMLHHYT